MILSSLCTDFFLLKNTKPQIKTLFEIMNELKSIDVLYICINCLKTLSFQYPHPSHVILQFL